MKPEDVSLIPAILTTDGSRFCIKDRLWQSAPSAALTEGGRIFCAYSGDNNIADEKPTNYNVCAYSDDGGEHFSCAFYAYHEHEVRISEALVFYEGGVLYHFWTQSYGYFDGRGGIFCVKCEEPDAPVPVFSAPCRLIDGFMAHTPTALSDNRWFFPSSIWTHLPSSYHPYPERERPSVWLTRDCGSTFAYLGGTRDEQPDFTENAVFEKKDGTLVMLHRSQLGICRAYSYDGGYTWTGTKKMPFDHPTARFFVSRFPSGALLLVCHYGQKKRSHLSACLSYDDGESFPYRLLLDERMEISYPSGNITKDGRAIIAYDRERTGAREILLASFTEEDVRNGVFGDGSFTKKIVAKGGTDIGV